MKTVLLTGASGAIGSALVPELLEAPDVTLRLLLRARNQAHLRERVNELCAYWQLSDSQRERLAAFSGDVIREQLGLSGEAVAQLRGKITHFVHAAGNVRLNRSLDEASDCAAGALRNVLEFCESAERFEKLEYLSTIGVAGRMPGLIPEETLPRPREFHNTYEEAKAEAEDLLREKMRRGLPATIHRPSMVVGDSRTGKIINFQVFYHLAEFLSGRKTVGLLPRTGEHGLDIIPVDYVARAIALSMRYAASVGRTFHLCSGPTATPRISDLATMVRTFMSGHGQRLPRLRRLESSWFRRAVPLIGRLTPGLAGRALRSLPHFLAYLDEQQHFGNARTREFLGPLGLALPRVEEYIQQVLSYRLHKSLAARA